MPRPGEACVLLVASAGARRGGEEKRREERGGEKRRREERTGDERRGQERRGYETLLAHWANLVNMSIWQSGEMYQSGHAGRVAIRSIMQSGQSGILLNMANLAALSIW